MLTASSRRRLESRGLTVGGGGSRDSNTAATAAVIPLKSPLATQLTEPKQLQDFSPELQHVIDLLALNDVARPIGSGAFTVHLYPSDLDLFERSYGCCGPVESAQYFASRLQISAQRIALDSNVYFSEVKAGTDTRFQPPSLGTLEAEDKKSIQPPFIQDFDSENLRDYVIHMIQSGLLSSEEAIEVQAFTEDAISGLLRDNKTAWQRLYDWFRKQWVLRWTLAEVIAGQKPLRRDNSMPPNVIPVLALHDAILQGTLVKMDLLTFSQNRLIAAEAVYDLYAYDSPEQRDDPAARPVPLTLRLGDYATSLRRDIIMYSSAAEFNPLKVAKRAWALAVNEGYEPLIGALSALFQSDVAAVGQVLSDAKEVQKALIRFPNMPVDKLVNVVLTFSKRLANHLPPESTAYKQSVQLANTWFNMLQGSARASAFDRPSAAASLQPLIATLQSIVTQGAVEYMRPMVPMLRELTLGLLNNASSGHLLVGGKASSLSPPATTTAPARPPTAIQRLGSSIKRQSSVLASASAPKLMLCSTVPPPAFVSSSAAAAAVEGEGSAPWFNFQPTADESGDDSEGQLGV